MQVCDIVSSGEMIRQTNISCERFVNQGLTDIGIILAYYRSRKERDNVSPICGAFGKVPFQILVIAGSLLATVGSVLKVV